LFKFRQATKLIEDLNRSFESHLYSTAWLTPLRSETLADCTQQFFPLLGCPSLTEYVQELQKHLRVGFGEELIGFRGQLVDIGGFPTAMTRTALAYQPIPLKRGKV
jgi:hypothetical protein